MTKKSPKEPVADKKPATDKAPPETPDTPDMPETPDTSDTPEASETELEKAQRESEENRNLYLHAVADLENYRNRIKKDMANAVQSVLGAFCLAICDVRDCMEAALASAKADEAKIKEGVGLTLRKMESAMEMQGILPVCPDIGITFDPQLHEAVSTQTKADLAPTPSWKSCAWVIPCTVGCLGRRPLSSAKKRKPATIIITIQKENKSWEKLSA